jgi:hypothetical protein
LLTRADSHPAALVDRRLEIDGEVLVGTEVVDDAGAALRVDHVSVEPAGTNQDRPPATLYRPSPRAYAGALPPVEYPGHFLVKRVTNAGTIRLKTRLLFIANALKQHPVGIEEVDDGIWSIHFCHVLLGRVHERDYIIRA